MSTFSRLELLTAFWTLAEDVAGVDPRGADETSRLVEDLDIDSLILLELLMLAEDRLDIRLEPGDFAEVLTVGDVVDVVMTTDAQA